MMSLQIEMISQIDAIGRKKLVDRLQFCARMVKNTDRVYFQNLATYFDDLYKTAMPIQEDTPTFRKTTKKAIEVLSKYNSNLNCRFLLFAKNLLKYRLEAVSGVKMAG